MALPPPYDQPPLYDQLLGDRSPPRHLSALVHSTVQGAIVAELATPETKTKLMQEVEALAHSGLNVNEAFERIRVGLGKVDEKNYRGKDGKPVDKFQPTWIGYQKRWTHLLWSSRDIATATEAYIKDFMEIIIPQVEAIQNIDDLADARVDLEAFIKRTDPFRLNSEKTIDTAEKCSQDFEAIYSASDAFKKRFENLAQEHATELDANIVQIQKEIKCLDAEIYRSTKFPLGIVLAVTLGGVSLAEGVSSREGSPAIIASLASLAPKVVIGIMIGGVTVAINKISNLIAYSWNKDRELNDLKAQIGHLEQMKADLEGEKFDMSHISDRLKAFSNIRAIVRNDAKLINDGVIASVGDPGSKNDFKRRVEMVKKSYSNLEDALSFYATKINISGAKKRV